MKETYNGNGYLLEVEGINIFVKNPFGDTYKGWLDENGKVATKSRLGLGYLVKACRLFEIGNKNKKHQ